jgi:hypothetical protein
MFINCIAEALEQEGMKYHGVMRIKPNNMMIVGPLGWYRGVEHGFYHVFANECRGVFCPQHKSMAYAFIVFPGV